MRDYIDSLTREKDEHAAKLALRLARTLDRLTKRECPDVPVGPTEGA